MLRKHDDKGGNRMNRILGVALGLGIVAAVAAILRGNRYGAASQESGTASAGSDRGAERLDAEQMPLATGRSDRHDVLGTAHTLPSSEAKYARAKDRVVRGKATSPEREAMYTDLSDVGASGSQGNKLGQEDRNPVGPFE
jgi:hypothetical protein